MTANPKVLKVGHCPAGGPAAIKEALEVLKEGGVAVFPTETYYGLGAHALMEEALERIFSIKGGGRRAPLLCLVDGIAMVRSLVKEIPKWGLTLMERFWPGPLTVVLPAREGLPRALVGPSFGVAVRASPHPVAGELVRGMGAPLVGTSANAHGGPPACSVEELDPRVAKAVDVILDSGRTEGRAPSTVVDCTTFPPKLIRRGCIGPSRIEEALDTELAKGTETD